MFFQNCKKKYFNPQWPLTCIETLLLISEQYTRNCLGINCRKYITVLGGRFCNRGRNESRSKEKSSPEAKLASLCLEHRGATEDVEALTSFYVL
jgi:hypothetical protein